jgi:hypothetical protein
MCPPNQCCLRLLLPQLPHYSKGQHLRKAGHLSNQLLAMACAEQPFCLPSAL